MRLKNKKNNWFSVVLSVFLVWFMLVLTVWTFNLILTELKDNKWAWSYLNAFAWAEWAQELALLRIKQKWYEYYDKIDHDINDRSVVLAKDPLDKSNFKKQIDVFLSYDLGSKTSSYTWEIEKLWYDIIPLFYEDKLWSWKSVQITLTSPDSSNLVWNIVWKKSWISWVWNIDTNTLWSKKEDVSVVAWEVKQKYSDQYVNDFLTLSDENYLILYNSNDTTNLSYDLKENSGQFFMKPKTEVISSGQVWNYKQNLRTKIDNTEFLNILKYSIFSE
jgi:hypothetical protein